MAVKMAIPRSRRSLLTSLGTAAAGAVAASVAGAQRVLAVGDDGQIIHIGDNWQDAQSTTAVNTNTDYDAFVATTYRLGSGVIGGSDAGNGVKGNSNSGLGTQGNSTTGPGTQGKSDSGPGVDGVSNTGNGVRGESTHGPGGWFVGRPAQLRLVPSPALSHPRSGQPGDLFVDAHYRLWFCKGGANWKQIA
jgi:hypothetical protein